MDKEQEEEGARYNIFLNTEVEEDMEVVEWDNIQADRQEDKEEVVQDKVVQVYDMVGGNEVYVQDSVYLQKYEYFYEVYIYMLVYD